MVALIAWVCAVLAREMGIYTESLWDLAFLLALCAFGLLRAKVRELEQKIEE